MAVEAETLLRGANGRATDTFETWKRGVWEQLPGGRLWSPWRRERTAQGRNRLSRELQSWRPDGPSSRHSTGQNLCAEVLVGIGQQLRAAQHAGRPVPVLLLAVPAFQRAEAAQLALH